jgi:hypothetical protein
MPATLPAPCFLRLGVILLGVVVLLWLTFEGRDERQAILLAILLSALGALATSTRFGRRLRGYWYILLGGAFGLLVPLMAVDGAQDRAARSQRAGFHIRTALRRAATHPGLDRGGGPGWGCCCAV